MRTKRTPYKRILSIDGGGIRGLIPALILLEIEKRTDKPIHELFDLIVGTSTGGILAIGLTMSGGPLSAKQLVSLYRDKGRKIFDRSLWKFVSSFGGISEERYSEDPLEKILQKLMGNTELKDTLCDIIITSYDIERREPYLFKSSKAENAGRNHLLRDVARATSAAPTYFEPLLLDDKRWPQEKKRRVLIDGGVFANNPTMIALSEALASGAKREEILLCSLGTGRHNRPIPYEEAKDWGMMGWMRPVLSVMMDGMSDSAHYHAEQVLSGRQQVSGTAQQRYFRFDTPLTDALDDLDNTTRTNINGLERMANEIMQNKNAELASLIQQLRPNRGPVRMARKARGKGGK